MDSAEMSQSAALADYVSQGERLSYARFGSGPELFLLHPTPVDHRFWLPLAFRLQDRYTITIPDLRGHGRSAAGHGGISMAKLAIDIERLLGELNIESACFAGCSVGSYVLYELWRRRPECIRALAFCCGKPQPDDAAAREKRKANIALIEGQGAAAFFDKTIGALFSPAFFEQQPTKVATLRAAMDAVKAAAAIAIQQGLMERPDSRPTIGTISVPVLALAAQKDALASPAEMQVIPELLPAAEYHQLDRAGHFAPYEEPETVGGILDRFFARVCRSEASPRE